MHNQTSEQSAAASVPLADSNRLTVGLATSSRQRELAAQLQQRIYAESGIRSPKTAEESLVGDLKKEVFVARQATRIIGTVSLICDGRKGLPIDRNLPDLAWIIRDLAEWNRQQPADPSDTIAMTDIGKSGLGEITSLAIDPEIRRTGLSRTDIFFQLTAELHREAQRLGMQNLVAVAHPKHGKAYRRMFNAQPIGEPFRYKKVGNRPAQAYVADISSRNGFHRKTHAVYFLNTAQRS
ncbi:MAG: hypothetical protein AAF958_06080, partial [Planctomycetota bacterium]